MSLEYLLEMNDKAIKKKINEVVDSLGEYKTINICSLDDPKFYCIINVAHLRKRVNFQLSIKSFLHGVMMTLINSWIEDYNIISISNQGLLFLGKDK